MSAFIQNRRTDYIPIAAFDSRAEVSQFAATIREQLENRQEPSRSKTEGQWN